MSQPSAFGLRLVSTFALPNLPLSLGGGPEVAFNLSRASALPPTESEPNNEYPAQGRRLSVFIRETGIDVQIHNLLYFSVDIANRAIDCVALTHVSPLVIRYWLLQQILPIFLLLEGSTELMHGAAIAHQEKAVVFLGQSGAGKSTLINYFLSQHCRLLTDEHVVISRDTYDTVTPALPFYRPYRSLEDLGLVASSFSVEPAPLSTMYILRAVSALAPIATHQISKSALIEEVFRNQQYNIHNPRLESLFPLVSRRFAGMSHLVRTVPLKYLDVPRSLSRLPDVYDFILNDVRRSPID